MSQNKSCFLNALHHIDILQKKSSNIESSNNCDQPFLGNLNNSIRVNTRPITFYRCDNSLISVSYIDESGNTNKSSTFRIENINENCVTCRILAPLCKENSDQKEEYISTNRTTIINLDCICAIKCLSDTFICL